MPCQDHASVAPADQTAAPIASAVSASPAVVTADTGVKGFGPDGGIVIRYVERLRLVHRRPVCSEDKAEWYRLRTGYPTCCNTTVPETVHASAFARLPGSGPRDYNGLIAETDGRAVALTHFLFHRHGRKIEATCDLNFYVDRAAPGAGRALIRAVHVAADAEGAPSVCWLTQDVNAEVRWPHYRMDQLTPFIRYNQPQQAR